MTFAEFSGEKDNKGYYTGYYKFISLFNIGNHSIRTVEKQHEVMCDMYLKITIYTNQIERAIRQHEEERTNIS